MKNNSIEIIINKIETDCKKNNIPMLRKNTADFLVDYIKNTNPKNILEIGTGYGYSALLMINSTNAKITTLEKCENNYKTACENFDIAGVRDRVNIMLCDAIEKLDTIDEKFDFIFLDGPKGQYAKYLPYLLKCLNNKGTLFADNVYYQHMVTGQVDTPVKKRAIVKNLRLFLELITTNTELKTTVYDIDDGFSVSVKEIE